MTRGACATVCIAIRLTVIIFIEKQKEEVILDYFFSRRKAR